MKKYSKKHLDFYNNCINTDKSKDIKLKILMNSYIDSFNFFYFEENEVSDIDKEKDLDKDIDKINEYQNIKIKLGSPINTKEYSYTELKNN